MSKKDFFSKIIRKFQFLLKKCFDKKLYEHINIKKCYVRKNVKSTKIVKLNFQPIRLGHFIDQLNWGV